MKLSKNRIAFLFFFISFSLVAQDFMELKGRITDLNKIPIENIAIRVIAPNREITQSYTDSNGFYYFYLPPNTYVLEALSFGSVLHTQSIDFKQASMLHDIALEPSSKLQEVVLVAKKPILSTTQDGFKLNVQGTDLANKGNALDVLKYVPSVSTRKGLEILGSSSYKIIYNNKELHLTEAQRMLFLKNLKSHRIQSIEVVDRPDASVASDIRAIIKIETQAVDGISASMASYVFYDKYIGNSNSLDLFYANNKFMLQSSFYNSQHRANLITDETKEITDYTYLMHRTSIIDREEWNFVLSGDYYLGATKSLGFFYNYTKNNDNNFSMRSNYEVASALDLKEIFMEDDLENKGSDHTLMLDYNQKLDSLGSRLSGSINYFFNTYKTPLEQHFKKVGLTETIIERNQQNTDDEKNIYALKIDWDKKYKNKSNLKLGAKYAYNKNLDSFSHYDQRDDSLILNNAFSNIFNYKEDNLALYASHRFSFKKSTFLLSSRLEYKDFDFSMDKGLAVKNDFLHILPTVYYSYQAFYFYFTKKLNYSNYYNYNPSIKKISELEYSSGNKNLEPIKTYLFQLGYSLKNKYSAILQYGYSDNYIYSLKSQYMDVATLSAPVNGGYLNYARLYLSGSTTFFDWWESTNKINLGYNDFYVSKISNTHYNGYSIEIDTYHNFSLAPDVDLSLDFNYTSRSKALYVKNKESFTANLDLSILVLKNAFLELAVEDVFNSEKEGYQYDFNGVSVHSVTKPHTGRTFLLGFRYHFNKGKEIATRSKKSAIEAEKENVKK